VPVDVVSRIEIDRPRGEVAAFASDPDHATTWYENIKAVEWKTLRPLEVGSQIAFIAEFLGRRLEYTYEVIELDPGERFVMGTSEGPFPMETTYTWADNPSAGTLMTLRNRGEPSGFAKIAGPMMAAAMGRANRKDLRKLKELLERSSAG
jgi:Polyketide cyclase / dehydrase and lipid transport